MNALRWPNPFRLMTWSADAFIEGMATSRGVILNLLAIGLLGVLFLVDCNELTPPLPPLPADHHALAMGEGGPLAGGRYATAVPQDALLAVAKPASLEMDGKRYAVGITGASRDEIWLDVGHRTVVVSQSISLGPPGRQDDADEPGRAWWFFVGVMFLAWIAYGSIEKRVVTGRWGAGALDLARATEAVGMLLSCGGLLFFIIFDVKIGTIWALLPVGWYFGLTFAQFERHPAFLTALEGLRGTSESGLDGIVPKGGRWRLSLEHWEVLSRIDREKGDIIRQLIVIGVRPVPILNSLAAKSGADRANDGDLYAAELQQHREHNERCVERLKICIDLGLLVLTADRLQLTLLAREQLALPTMLLLPRMPEHARAQLARATADLQRGEALSAASLCGGILEGLSKHVVKQCLKSDISAGELQRAMKDRRIRWSNLEQAELGTLSLVLGELFGEQRSTLPLSDFGEIAQTHPRLEFGRTLGAMLKAAAPIRNSFAHANKSVDQSKETLLAFRLLQLTRVFGEIVAELVPGEDPSPDALVEQNSPAPPGGEPSARGADQRAGHGDVR